MAGFIDSDDSSPSRSTSDDESEFKMGSTSKQRSQRVKKAPRIADDEEEQDDDIDDENDEDELDDRRDSRADKGKGEIVPNPRRLILRLTAHVIYSIGKERVGRKVLKSKSKGFSWEETYERSWDSVKEDARGSLEGAVSDMLLGSSRTKRVLRDTTSIQRGIIRHVYLVIDLSLAMLVKEFKATWLDLTLQFAQVGLNSVDSNISPR